jgi:HlyD family secretion protein
MNRRVIVIVVIVVLAVAGYFGWQYYTKTGVAASNELGGSGTIETEQVAITPQTTGRIIEAPPNEGVPVKAGDVLYRLDPSVAKLNIEQARAGQKAAAANYKHVKNDSGSTSADIATAKAQLDQATVAVELAAVQESYTVVRSPLDGTIANVIANVGENAVPGNNLAIVSNPASLTVTIYIPENRIGEVHVGQDGELTTDSTPGKTYKVKVDFIGSQAEFTPASIETKDQRVKLVYQVKCRIIDPDQALKAGMPADVVLK